LQIGALTLSDLTIVLLKDATGQGFLFGDSPVVYYNRAAYHIKHMGMLGEQCRGLQVFFPVSPALIVFMFDPAVYRLSDAAADVISVVRSEDVDAINKLQLHTAADVGYFGEYMKHEYVRRLWEEERMRRKFVEYALVEGPAIINGRQNGDIIHTYLPQVEFQLDLSFIQFDPVPEMMANQPRSMEILQRAWKRGQLGER
jgi:hypothetical protein